MERVGVVVLGATGMVGQRLLERLDRHPWFEVVAVAASDRSVGRALKEASRWRLPGAWPAAGALPVLPCHPATVREAAPQARLVLSALPSDAAREVEPAFARAGFAVLSNASAFRQHPLVPLVIPEVNAAHLRTVRERTPFGPGFVVTNPNCCAIPVALALAPLHAAFEVEAVVVSTWQAVSGAGYPGESAWDVVGNVHPHAGDEEEKLAVEPQKILGSVHEPAAFPLSARCVRVPVADGHLVSLQVRTRRPCTPDDARAAWQAWRPDLPALPSLPERLFVELTDRDRPMPRLDADLGGGMSVALGRVEPCPVMGLKLFALAHNAVRGAAGAALANAELCLAWGLV